MANTFAPGVAAALLAAATSLAACATRAPTDAGPYRAASLRPYEVNGETYRPRIVTHYDEVGQASWYDYPAHTRHTSIGDWFDGGTFTAAHRTLPLPCVVEVTNLENGRSIRVTVNDRGPFVRDRLIDLSRAAADRLGFSAAGTTRVRIRFLGPAQAPSMIGMAAVAPPGA